MQSFTAFSEALILASIKLKYDNRLLWDLPEQNLESNMLCTLICSESGVQIIAGKVKSISPFFVSFLDSQKNWMALDLLQMLLHTTVLWVVEDSKQHSVMLSVLIRLSKFLQLSKDSL